MFSIIQYQMPAQSPPQFPTMHKPLLQGAVLGLVLGLVLSFKYEIIRNYKINTQTKALKVSNC